MIQERLTGEFSKSPHFASHLGVTLNNMAEIDLDRRNYSEATAKLKRAIEWQRKALAVNPNHPVYRQYLIVHLTNLLRAAEGQGRPIEANRARRELAELTAADPAQAALDARLAAVLKGQAPKDNSERIQLAFRAYEKALHASSARLYAEALANDGNLALDRQAQHRYSAACAAALAASCTPNDDRPADRAARAELRREAVKWLADELATWDTLLPSSQPEMKDKIAATLQHWKSDADLASIREERELAHLTDAERSACKRLWSDVDQALIKVTAKK